MGTILLGAVGKERSNELWKQYRPGAQWPKKCKCCGAHFSPGITRSEQDGHWLIPWQALRFISLKDDRIDVRLCVCGATIEAIVAS